MLDMDPEESPVDKFSDEAQKTPRSKQSTGKFLCPKNTVLKEKLSGNGLITALYGVAYPGMTINLGRMCKPENKITGWAHTNMAAGIAECVKEGLLSRTQTTIKSVAKDRWRLPPISEDRCFKVYRSIFEGPDRLTRNEMVIWAEISARSWNATYKTWEVAEWLAARNCKKPSARRKKPRATRDTTRKVLAGLVSKGYIVRLDRAPGPGPSWQIVIDGRPATALTTPGKSDENLCRQTRNCAEKLCDENLCDEEVCGDKLWHILKLETPTEAETLTQSESLTEAIATAIAPPVDECGQRDFVETFELGMPGDAVVRTLFSEQAVMLEHLTETRPEVAASIARQIRRLVDAGVNDIGLVSIVDSFTGAMLAKSRNFKSADRFAGELLKWLATERPEKHVPACKGGATALPDDFQKPNYSNAFQAFWDAYEFPEGKYAAWQVWQEIDVAEHCNIIAGALAYIPTQSPKLAAGWLTGRRFDDPIDPDEIDEVRTKFDKLQKKYSF